MRSLLHLRFWSLFLSNSHSNPSFLAFLTNFSLHFWSLFSFCDHFCNKLAFIIPFAFESPSWSIFPNSQNHTEKSLSFHDKVLPVTARLETWSMKPKCLKLFKARGFPHNRAQSKGIFIGEASRFSPFSVSVFGTDLSHRHWWWWEPSPCHHETSGWHQLSARWTALLSAWPLGAHPESSSLRASLHSGGSAYVRKSWASQQLCICCSQSATLQLPQILTTTHLA